MSRSVAPRDLRSQMTLDSVGFRGPGSVQDRTTQPAPSYSLGDLVPILPWIMDPNSGKMMVKMLPLI